VKISKTETNSGLSSPKPVRKKRSANKGQEERKAQTITLCRCIMKLSGTTNAAEVERKLCDQLSGDQETEIFGPNWGDGVRFRRNMSGEIPFKAEFLLVVATAAVSAGFLPKNSVTKDFFADLLHPENFEKVLKTRVMVENALSELHKAALGLKTALKKGKKLVFIDQRATSEIRNQVFQQLSDKAHGESIILMLNELGIDDSNPNSKAAIDSICNAYLLAAFNEWSESSPAHAYFNIDALIHQLNDISVVLTDEALPASPPRLPPTQNKIVNQAAGDATEAELDQFFSKIKLPSKRRTGTKLAQRKPKYG
jgi:hypothetical protein